ncbi:MAG: polymer-forming cytoskeletal protein [Bacillota bacterium]|nr:polymer-forming cytoskeletal protein [Bacillota bacterium]
MPKDITRPEKIDVALSPDTKLTGDIESKGLMCLDGSIKGNIKMDGDVYIGKTGAMEGNISAREVQILGRVTGNITATGTLRMFNGATLQGDVQVGSFVAEQGAVFKGKCTMSDFSDLKG